MSALVINRISYCRSCRQRLGAQIGLSTIGSPLMECPKCQAINSLAPKVMEWCYMSFVRKLGHILGAIFWGLIMGAVFFAVIMYIAIQINPAYGNKSSSNPALLFYILGCILGLFISIGLLLKLIKKSNTRVSDPEYLKKLALYGVG